MPLFGKRLQTAAYSMRVSLEAGRARLNFGCSIISMPARNFVNKKAIAGDSGRGPVRYCLDYLNRRFLIGRFKVELPGQSQTGNWKRP